MAITDNYVGNSKRVKVELEPTVQLRETVRVMLLHPGNVHYTGTVTGQRYTWHGAGTVIEIDAEDVEGLLKKKSRSCVTCSGILVEQPFFEIVR